MLLGLPSTQAVFPRNAACIALILLCSLPPSPLSAAEVRIPQKQAAIQSGDEAMLEELEHASFRFFAEQADPRTGLVRDRARADGSPSEGKASIAASGFALTAWVIAVEHGWIARPAAVEHVRAALQFLVNEAPRQHGFFYHFMEMTTGQRAWQSEVSSIDSSLLFAGAMVAREYFADPRITALVNQLLDDIDWNWFRNGGQLIALSWHDETGFSRYRWNIYSEHLLMSFLVLGVSKHPLEAGYWQSWQRRTVGRYKDYVYLQEPPLFVNQFPMAFMDLRGRRDAFADYFHNTRLATLAQRQFSLDLRGEFPAWNENLWGLTASDSATGYKAWGGPPRTTRFNSLDGTVVPCAAAGSLPFAPGETLAVLRHLRTVYGDRLWTRYGFVDAFNPNTGWVNQDVIGIDVGISMVQAENLRTGLINRLFMQSPEARLSLSKAGFLDNSRELDSARQASLLAAAGAAWHTLQSQPATPGLQLTALIAAQQLGLVTGNDLVTAARALLTTVAVPPDAQFAAALLVLRQSVPALATEASLLLAGMAWNKFPAAGPELGAVSRLGVFLQIAGGARPAADWLKLSRATTTLGPVQVLAPVDVAGALLPGLWLDERSILSGAATSQLAYASLTGNGPVPADPLLPVLQLDQFPVESLSSACPPPTTPDAAAAFVITAANLLSNDCVRQAFQVDPLVVAGRAAIAEFGEAAFGSNTSVIAQRELAGTKPPGPQRQALASANTLPREEWDWQRVAGMEFKDSDADVRPGDAPLEFRFALTWDQHALYLHAEVTDTPAGYTVPPERNRAIELFIDPAGDGFNWSSMKDCQFTFRVSGATENLHQNPLDEVRVSPTAQGYTVETAIPWSSLGLVPKPGLEFGLTAAAVSESPHEWETIIKLNWSWASVYAGFYRLGRVRLQ
jgi:hypothetical protein